MTTLIDQLLLEQQSLTAVERFSRSHDRGDGAPQAHYRDLIPLNRPRPGEQYAFEVDLQACSGCKACVVACHSLNGLDAGESWRETGTLVGGNGREAFQQTVTTACHHCADPGCANGCPTRAYEKEADTGVVRHLDDQCIGCRYCEMKCPYGVPKFNERLGIVRKCDLCHSRLAAGESPACVQACPNGAIRIRIVTPQEIAERSAPGVRLLPGTVPSEITRPATRFLNLREGAGERRPGWRDGEDEPLPAPEHGHFPLVWMLVLTQAGAGLLAFDWLGRLSGAVPSPGMVFLATVMTFGGLAGSVWHLGRPLQAWRSFLGWRRSWMSREVIVFGAWSSVLAVHAGAVWLAPGRETLILASGALAALLGGAGVFCSVMVYADTPRTLWRFSSTAPGFLLTALILGSVWTWPGLAAVALIAKMGWEARVVSGEATAFRLSGRLLRGPLYRLVLLRSFSAIGGLFFLWPGVAQPGPAFLTLLVSELIARSLFFKAVVAPKML